MPRLRFPDHALILRMLEHCIASGRPLMFAHDDGVYLCADGLRTDAGFRMKCAHAEGCDPTQDAEWFETARRLVGGDDFGEYIHMSAPGAALLIAAMRRGERLVLIVNRKTIELVTERVVAPKPTTPAARGRGTESPSNARERIVDMTTKTQKQKKAKAAPKSVERLTKDARAEIAQRLADGKQDHEVPTAKEIANNANVEAAVKAATESPTAANGALGGKKATAGAKATKRAPAAAKAPKGEKTKRAKPAKEAKPKRVSALDAAAMVLRDSKEPMNTTDLIKTMAERKIWTSPNGATPEQTLYAAIVREINSKGKDARFVKVDRGHFAANPKAV